MVETAKRVAEAGKPSPDPAPAAGATVASNAAAASRVWRCFSYVATVIATLIVAPVVTHFINVMWIDPPLTDQQQEQQKQAADALWTRCDDVNAEVQAWRGADAQEYRLVMARLVEVADRSNERQALMKAAPVLSQVLDMHEADESEALTFAEDLLASSKRAIPVSRALADKLALLGRDADGLHATTEYAKDKQALVKTRAAQLREEVVTRLKHDADFLTTAQGICRDKSKCFEQDPAVKMPLTEVRVEDKQRVERYRDQCSRLRDGWGSVNGQSQELADAIFPYVAEYQRQQGK